MKQSIPHSILGVIGCLLFVLLFATASSSPVQEKKDIDKLAIKIAGEGGNTLERARSLVFWIHENFEFVSTDYKQRTVEELMRRRAGNCAEQARVLQEFLKAVDVPSRWVAEINIQPKSERRKKDAESLVAEQGARASVFGYMHNDHRWLEVYDDVNKIWVPADPSLGIFGTEAWVKARVGFDERPGVIQDMIVPFVVVVRKNDKTIEDRSEYYLIEGFNSYYGHKLEKSPLWQEWVFLAGKLSAYGSSAFAGEVNLHHYTFLMERLLEVYAGLKNEYITIQTQDHYPFIEKTFSKKLSCDISVRHLIFLPVGYEDSPKKWPLLLYLHGGMGRGSDFKKLYWYPVPKMILEEKYKLPFIVLIPQCPEGKMWSGMELIEVAELLKHTIRSYKVDSTRVYAVGYSMGGNGVLALANYVPDMFAAIAPMSGMSNTWWASRLKDVPSWFFHGEKDDHVSVRESDEMVAALKKEGAEVRYLRSAEKAHSPPTEKEHLELFRWLLKHKKNREGTELDR
jgi:acetyl esterase/lipase